MKVLLLSILLLPILAIGADTYPYTSRLKETNGNSVKVNDSATVSVTDPGLSISHYDSDVRSYITLGINHEYEGYIDGYDLEVEVKITATDTANNSISVSNQTLTIEHNPYSLATNVDIMTKQFADGYEFTFELVDIKVNGVADSLPLNAYVEGTIIVDRLFDFESSSSTAPTTNSTNFLLYDCENDTIPDAIEFSWATVDGAEGYHVEWSFINDYKDYDFTSTITYLSTSEIDFDFKYNSTRVSTNNTNYIVPMVFDHGYVVFRVRAYGIDNNAPDHYIYGAWSAPETGSIDDLSNLTQYIYNPNPHELSMNWQLTTTFAEEGKKKEVISYYDGSLRNRQSVTRINTDDNTIVGETKYDHQGRPAVNILPVPVRMISCSGDTISSRSLAYYSDFNKNTTGDSYSRDDFDLDGSTACETDIDPLGTTTGAGEYYSTDNPDKEGFQKYIPDANGYAMAQVEYTPDNTGRIRRQGGVGEDFKLGSDHETKYYYGKPVQISLNRVFGSEVGYASHYKKNLVVDPNGQVSVSYLDQEGRVIATALAGDDPTNLTAIDSENGADETMLVDLFEENSDDESLVNTADPNFDGLSYASELLVSYQSNYEFIYDMSVDRYTEDCLQDTVCFHCVYELELKVIDECNNELIDSNDIVYPTIVGVFEENGGEIEFKYTCVDYDLDNEEVNPTESNIKFNMTLEVGNYTLIKNLKISEDAFDQYRDWYIDSAYNECILDYEYFADSLLALIDSSDCNISCDDCVTSLGNRDDWISEGFGTGEEWDVLYEECMAPCKSMTRCEAAYESMLSDVSIEGQYGDVYDAQGQIYANALGVFNVNNVLQTNSTVGGVSANWRYPVYTDENGVTTQKYYNDDGSETRVYLTDNNGGVGNPDWAPQILSTATVQYDNNGFPFVYPQELLNLADYLETYWEPSHAKSMVQHHPEYCYYKACIEYSDEDVNDWSSNDFDEKILQTIAFDDAETEGLLVNNGTTGAPDYSIAHWDTPGAGQNYDPFMDHVGENSTDFGQELEDRLTTYIQITDQFSTVHTYSIIDVAAIMARCGGTAANIDPSALTLNCLQFGRDSASFTTQQNTDLHNLEWQTLVNLYQSAKQELQIRNEDEYAYENQCACDCIGDKFYMPFNINPLSNSSNTTLVANSKHCTSYVQAKKFHRTRRFGDGQDELANQDQDELEYQMYLQTGQCPAEINLEHLLNGLSAYNGIDTDTELTEVSAYYGLVYELLDDNTVVPSSNTWDVTNTVSTFKAEFTDPSTEDDCELVLNPLGQFSDWSEVVAFAGLKSTGNDINGNVTFEVTAIVVDGNGTHHYEINGHTCLSIKDCQFHDVCDANEVGEGFVLLMSALAANSELTVTSAETISGSPDYDDYQSLALENSIGGATTTWVYDSGTETFTFDNSTNAIELRFTTTPSSWGDVKFFANLQSAYQHYFTIEAYDVNGDLISTLEGESWFDDGSSVDPYPLGECGLPTPLECQSLEHETFEDLQDLLIDMLPQLSSNDDLFTSQYMTNILLGQLPAATSSSSTEISASINSEEVTTLKYTVAADEQACDITLVATHPSITLSFEDLTSTLPYNFQIADDQAGQPYYDFTADMQFDLTGGGTYLTTVEGTSSCLSIQECPVCQGEEGSFDDLEMIEDSVCINQDLDGFYAIPLAENEYFLANRSSGRTYHVIIENGELTANFVTFQTRNAGVAKHPTKTMNGYPVIVGAYRNNLDPSDTYYNENRFFEVYYDGEEWVRDTTPMGPKLNNKGLHNVDLKLDSYEGREVNGDPVHFIALRANANQNDTCGAISVMYKSTSGDYVYKSIFSGSIADEFNVTDLNVMPNGDLLFSGEHEDSAGITGYIAKFTWTNSLGNNDVLDSANWEYFTTSFYDTNSTSYKNWDSSGIILRGNDFIAKAGHLEVVGYDDKLNARTGDIPMFWTYGGVSGSGGAANDVLKVVWNDTVWEESIVYNNLGSYGNQHHGNLHRTLNGNQMLCLSSTVTNLFTLIDIVSEDVDFQYGYSAPAEECIPMVVDSTCSEAYDDYLTAVSDYNTEATSNSWPTFTNQYNLATFTANFCNCVDNFEALVQAVIDSAVAAPVSTEQADLMFDLANICSPPPCEPDIESPVSLPVIPIPDSDPCLEQQYNNALANAQILYDEYIEAQLAAFEENYLAHCMAPDESYTAEYDDKEYHYTLYYYDQAGNLVKTVPPEGVNYVSMDYTDLNDATRLKLQSDRDNHEHTVFTSHRMATKYQYNSLNQLVKQSLPDHDQMDIWEYTLPNGLDNNVIITSIDYTNESQGFLTGYKNVGSGQRGYMYKTSDGGQTWKKLSNIPASKINDLCFVSTTQGYAVSDNGINLRTSDGGITWDMQNTYDLGVTSNLNSLSSDGAGEYLIVGDEGTMIKFQSGTYTLLSPTFSGGSTAIASSDNIVSTIYDNGQYFMAVNQDVSGASVGKVYRSAAIAGPWTEIAEVSLAGYTNTQIVDGTNLSIALSSSGALIKTENSGSNWFVMPTEELNTFRDVYFLDENQAVAIIEDANSEGKLMKSTDGGFTWEEIDPTETGDFNDFYTYYEDGSNTYAKLVAVGNDGVATRILMQDGTPFGLSPINSSETDDIITVWAGEIGSELHVVAATDGTTDKVIHLTDAVNDGTWDQVNTITATEVAAVGNATNLEIFIIDGSDDLNHQAYILSSGSYGTLSSGLYSGNDFSNLAVEGDNLYLRDLTNNTLGEIDLSTAFSAGTFPSLGTITGFSGVTSTSLDVEGTTIHLVSDDGKINHGAISGGSATWTENGENINPQPLSDLSLLNSSKISAVGENGALMILSNSSSNLAIDLKDRITSEDLRSAEKTATDVIAAVGTNGTAYKLTHSSGTIAETTISIGNTNNLNDVAYDATNDRLYIAGESGNNYVVNPLAGSTPSATAIPNNSNRNFNSVCFNNGVSVFGGDESQVYYGDYNNLMQIKNIYPHEMTDVHFSDDLNGYAIGKNFTVRRTSDAGQTWDVVLPDNDFSGGVPDINAVHSTTANKAIIVGMSEYITEANLNETSELTAPTGTFNFNDVVFLDQNTGFIAGNENNLSDYLAKTTNGGSTWTDISLGSESTINALHLFENNGDVIAVGESSTIMYYDGSTTSDFSSAAPINNASLNDVYFHDNTVGYIVGDGFVWKCPSATINSTSYSITSLTFEDKTVSEDLNGQTTAGSMNFNAIDFATRYDGFLGGEYATTGYDGVARNLNDESDEFSTYFYYDKLGRIVVSQNSKQFENDNFSYTLYDELGRVIEAGEKVENTTDDGFESIFGQMVSGHYNPNVINDTKLTDWIEGDGTRREVTHTFYDEVDGDIATVLSGYTATTFTQENLRKRISAVAYFDEHTSSFPEDYSHATHYTYDIHGNVNTLIQDNQNVGEADERFKRIDYEYDLISGNVHEVIYQEDQPDQWIHKYTYDGDNRIEDVSTSADGFNYDSDARYFYYAHGPLARVELGENNVQGMDYAYTIQGWLKGVNSDILNPNNDMGHDGDFDTTNANGMFAKDAMGFSLGYFEGDYKAIDGSWTSSPADRWLAQTSGSDLINDRNDLYNGNIGHMVTSILEPDEFTHSGTEQHTVHTQGTVYDYDQLNRLIESRSWQNIDVVNNDWDNGTTATNKYKNAFAYDANGNILKQLRYDGASSPVLLDSLTYKYHLNSSGKRVRNRLYHVDDQTADGVKTDDIDDMGTMDYALSTINTNNNYSYDEIGQLIKDEQEEIYNIEWRVDGKIKAIIRETTSSKNSLIFHYDALGNRIAKKEYEPTDTISDSLNVWVKSTYYVRDAQGNVMAIYDHFTESSNIEYHLKERNIYGSARVGINTQVVDMKTATDIDETHELGARHYELSNHLGNVLAVVSDKKIPRETGTPDGIIDAYEPAVLNSADYSPFGVQLEGRTFSGSIGSNNVDDYRHGYQGSEKDDEVKETGNSYTTYFRQLDPRLGRWLTIDPKKSATESPYVSMANNPLYFNDVLGDSVKNSMTSAEENKALELFMSTAHGKNYIGKYAAKGQTIGGVTFTEDGKYHKKGYDLNLTDEPVCIGYHACQGQTSVEVDEDGRLQITVNMVAYRGRQRDNLTGGQELNDAKEKYGTDSKEYKKAYNEFIAWKVQTLMHELFIHAETFAKDFTDDGAINTNYTYKGKSHHSYYASRYNNKDVKYYFSHDGSKVVYRPVIINVNHTNLFWYEGFYVTKAVHKWLGTGVSDEEVLETMTNGVFNHKH